MKDSVIQFILLFLAALTFSFSEKKFNPVGTWKVINLDKQDGKTEYMKFYQTGLMRFVTEKDSILGGEAAYRYKFDFKKDPAWFTIEIYSLGGDKIGLIEGIINIKSKNSFVAKISRKSRPKKFDSGEGEMLEFTRFQ